MLRQLIAIALIILAACQSCLSPNGTPVHWWIVLKVPPKIGIEAYGYYDSIMHTSQFTLHQSKIDSPNTPLTRTFDSINKGKWQLVAWNDEKPSGQTSLSVAHSKGLIAFNTSSTRGVFIDHSIPKYPAINSGMIDPRIQPAQNVYGQHIACFTLTISQLDSIAANMLITMPYIYASFVHNTTATRNLYRLATKQFQVSSKLFYEYTKSSAVGYVFRSIYKNNKLNGSIFEDGLTSFLGASKMIAQTWGRPLDPAWCNKGIQVLNANTLSLNQVSWTEPDDHSKWVLVPSHYACFGDMNRMHSQWKRGGAFFCLADPSLIGAMTKVLKLTDKC